MRRTGADARSYSLHTLTNGDHERAWYRRTIDPIAGRVLSLQALVIRGLQQIRRQHTVFMGANSLTHTCTIVWIFSVATIVSVLSLPMYKSF